jgi:hypothetical protein
VADVEQYSEPLSALFNLRRHGHRLFAATVAALLACEAVYRLPSPMVEQYLRVPFGGRVWTYLYPVFSRYLRARYWVLHHQVLTAVLALTAVLVGLLAWRKLLLLWHNEILPRIAGTYLEAHGEGSFPRHDVNLLRQIRDRPPESAFIGLTPVRKGYRTLWEPVYIDQRLRTTHIQVMGKTGSGKTQSVIWPLVYQDILDGKGVVVISGKGSDEEIRTMKAMALLAGRAEDLRVFSLPAWNRPSIPTHTYNMVHVTPWGPNNAGGDVVATAERVFSVLPMGGNDYYDQQAQVFFKNLCRALHGMEDPKRPGHGAAFTMRDIATCLKGVANPDSPHGGGLELVLRETATADGKEAAVELRSQISRLDRDVHKVLSGLVGAVDQFQAPIVNATSPSLIMEEVLETPLLVYIQLPANLYRIQAPALGQVFLQDIQQEGSLRQVYRTQRKQTPFAIYVDEFARFATLEMLPALSQLRDSKLQYLLAHQSPADLELVSEAYATGTWDNTRVKIILNQDNPELCERIGKSIGTYQEVELTVRRDPGPLFTSLQSGVASSRKVETYKLHPNRIKNLAPFGQAYLLAGDVLKPLCLGMMPATMTANYPLAAVTGPGYGGIDLHEKVMARATAREAARPPRRASGEDDDSTSPAGGVH